MFDAHAFFKTRFSAHLRETSRYLRYIFNGHIAIAMLFFISAMAVFYQQWLAQLPDNFPAGWIMGIGFGLLVSYSPVRTLLKEPDLIFLIAAEHKMKDYFRDALIYSFVIQLYLILLVAAVFGPLYFTAYPERPGKMYLLSIAVVLIFKVWNLIANWWMLKVRDVIIRRIELTVRFVLNCAIFYFLINGDVFFAAIATVLFIVLFLYDFSMSGKQSGLAWDLLVEKDQHRMQSFYRFANMFTDVPHLKNKVKKRQWLVSLLNNVQWNKTSTYDYLYRITFIRGGDYLGMYVRLVVIGGLVIYFIPNLWMKLLFALLFLYMSTFQMMTLYNHHRTVMWLDLYPVPEAIRQKSLLKWLMQLAVVQSTLFAVVFLLEQQYLGFLIALLGGVAFNVVFIKGYVKKKISS